MTSSPPDTPLLQHSRVVRQPDGAGPGYWAGAPGAFYAPADHAYYLTYRMRRPRGIAPDRGGEARIARSTDLARFEDIWSVTKDAYGTASIERSAIRQGQDGAWRYFTSFVDPADGRWCVSVLHAPTPHTLHPPAARRLFTAGPLGLEGIKDPWVFEAGGVHYMVLSVATPTPRTGGQSHATSDIFNTGDCLSATGLARSHDLDTWEWLGVIFAPPGSGWDAYCRRITSIVPHRGRFIGFYDGSASHRENYEERTGIAVSRDLHSWETLTPGGPVLASPHASGSLRYLDHVATDDGVWAFYECTREDGAHDLQVARLDLDRVLAAAERSGGSA